MRRVVLFGDSDISRWPPSLYPSLPSVDAHDVVSNHGVGGAVIADMLRQIEEWKAMGGEDGGSGNNYIFICCAGENDLGTGRSMHKILEDFRAFLNKLLLQSSGNCRLIFLGPKFEPWLTHDNSSRKQYAKLNNSLQRAVRKHPASAQIHYIDCLTSFCTEETATVPGAVHGGKAMPDSAYFDADGLHLSDAGYLVWKQLVEDAVAAVTDS